MGKQAAAETLPWPKLKTKLGPYRLMEELGRGGMGRVYLAMRQKENLAGTMEEVALKVLDPELAKRELVRDFFVQEAELGKGLAHPNLVAFLDSGEYRGFHYLAFEFIHGMSLDHLLKKEEGGFSNDLALSVLEDVTFGLAAAHQRGIVHRDLKPQNVMITPDDEIKVIDFGLADSSAGIGEGKTVGTPVYAAPEQNLGKKTAASADVYSLGLMTYEMFSGSRLLPGGGLKKVLQQQIKLQKVLEKGVSLNPRIPKELTNVLRKMLEFKPSERYPSAVELAADLERTLPKRESSRSAVLAKSKGAAVAELADTHYWKCLEAAREQRYDQAALEAGRLVALRPPNVARLKSALQGEIINLAWDPAMGGPSGPGEEPPQPDLEGVEALCRMAAAAELSVLKALLQGRLARLAAYYDPPWFQSLAQRSHDAIPILYAVFIDPASDNATRGRMCEGLAWMYLSAGCPERAQEIAEEGLRLDPGNPALTVAQQQIDRKLKAAEESQEAIAALTKVLATLEEPEDRIAKVVQFAERHPYLPEARQLQMVEARRAGSKEAVADAYVALALRDILLREKGFGYHQFRLALGECPRRSDLQFFLVEALRMSGRTLYIPRGRTARVREIQRLLGVVDPLMDALEEDLTGAETDRELLRELAALAAEKPDLDRCTGYLVRLGSLELALDNREASRQAFEEAMGVSPARAQTAASIQAVPSIGHIFNRLELARLASEGR